jgi:hypothetical protein
LPAGKTLLAVTAQESYDALQSSTACSGLQHCQANRGTTYKSWRWLLHPGETAADGKHWKTLEN